MELRSSLMHVLRFSLGFPASFPNGVGDLVIMILEKICHP